jgi:signal transduction histidine kinase
MWATLSPSTNRRLVAAWGVFASINVVLMYLLPGQETVPFHFVWISLALVYGFTTWRTSWMIIALVFVVVTTGYVLVHHAASGEIRWEESTEEPLMAAIFGVMVWHVYRRQQLLREVQRIHELEHRRGERQQLFVRLASHELRTPITVARGYTELVRAAHSDESTVEDTGIVLDELDKVAGITQRLVTLMQLDEPHPVRRVDVDAEVLRLVRRWAPTADRDWCARSTIGDAVISPDRLEAALDCLVENAIKFTKPGQRIEVTGARHGEGWTVQVRDYGVGLSPEKAQQLLSRPPGQGTGTGTGLGLAIVQAVAESLDGWLTITGEPGAGTTVTLHVPQAALPRLVGPNESSGTGTPNASATAAGQEGKTSPVIRTRM